MSGLWGLPCFTHAEWVPTCTKLCMNVMQKLQCVEVTVLQEFAQWTVDRVQAADLLWNAQKRLDLRHHTLQHSFSHFVSSRGWRHMISQVKLENVAQPCGRHMIIMITHIFCSKSNLVELISNLAAVPFQVLHGCSNGSNIFRLAAGLAAANTCSSTPVSIAKQRDRDRLTSNSVPLSFVMSCRFGLTFNECRKKI